MSLRIEAFTSFNFLRVTECFESLPSLGFVMTQVVPFCGDNRKTGVDTHVAPLTSEGSKSPLTREASVNETTSPPKLIPNWTNQKSTARNDDANDPYMGNSKE